MQKIKPKNLFNKRNYIIVGVILFLALSLSFFIVWQWLYKKSVNVNGTKNIVYVKTNQSFESIFAQLKHKGLLQHPEGFYKLANWLKLPKKIHAGKYNIDEPLSNLQLVRIMLLGKQKPFNIVFNYAERKENIAGFFGSKLETDSSYLINLLRDTSLIGSMGFDTNTIVNLFIPNTYNFYWNTSGVQLLNRMLSEYRKFWNADRQNAANNLGLTANQVSILASIVQKETNKYDEMPIVAGVYINRLNRNIPLQADPTLVFILNNPLIKRVTNAHTKVNSMYNTYMHTGLPPGPLCTPSQQAIDAVLNYTKHRYIYFCAKEDFSGYHNFAETLVQHNKNARKYQRALNQIGIK